MEEKVTLVRQLAQRMKDQGSQPDAGKYEEYAGKVDAEVSLVRDSSSTELLRSVTFWETKNRSKNDGFRLPEPK
jgi:hypothetical protein